jgi:predicted TIM-barrel fold metal-dependent hydrolase
MTMAERKSRAMPQQAVQLPVPTRLYAEGASAAKQTAAMRRVEAGLLQLADRLAAPLGMDRRRFLQSSCGMAAAFLALNGVFGPLFAVAPAEAADPEAAAARAAGLKGQLIFDVQTHFVHPAYPSTGILGLRELARPWNPQLQGEQTLADIRFDSYFREVFLQSDTALALLSNAPHEDPQRWFLSNDEAARARAAVNDKAGSRRLFTHAVFTPGAPGWLEELERAAAWRPDGWKGYTVGSPFGESKWPWRLDDEKLVYPAYERMVKAGITTVAIHKGLLPSGYRQKMAQTWRYGGVDDLPRAARDWPQLNFVIYHSALRDGGIPSKQEQENFERTGEIPWVSELARIPGEHGVKNVFAELGSIFAITAVSAPRYCAGILGTLIKGMGEEKVVWGTDSVWYGGPQWQIEALRRLEIPEDLQKKFGFRPLGPADGAVKNKVFAANAAAIHPYSAAAVGSDELARMKEETRKKSGTGRP